MMPNVNIQRETLMRAGARSGRANKGFSFTEVMVALLIFVVLTAFVATGIPVAFKTYQQVVDYSNAQVALSTTVSSLRDELGLAVDVKATNTNVYYRMSDGNWAMIENGDTGLVRHVYAGEQSPGTEITSAEIDLIPEAMIVGSSGGDSLKVEMVADDSGAFITFSNGVFTVNSVVVEKDGTTVDSVDEYKVKAVFDPA